jgi:hypothetical protein
VTQPFLAGTFVARAGTRPHANTEGARHRILLVQHGDTAGVLESLHGGVGYHGHKCRRASNPVGRDPIARGFEI